METYRQELDKLDTYLEKGKLHHSMLSVMVYKFLHWIKIKLSKRDGWVDYMSKDKNCMIMTDIIIVLNNIINDVMDQMDIVLNKNQNLKLKELEIISRLIIENFDNPIRSNPNIIYDEEEDERNVNPLINSNMIQKLENLIQIDNYLDEQVVNT